MAKKLTATRLPKELYTYKEKDSDSEYYITNDIIDDCATPDGERTVGVYALVRTIRVSFKVEVVEIKEV